MRRKLLILALLGVFLLGAAGFAAAATISVNDILSDWTQTHDFLTNTSDAIWQNSSGDLWNGGNRHGTIVSDFTTVSAYSFSARLRSLGDNDLMGLVFGWQDFDNTYSLTWGGGGGSYDGIHIYKEVSGSRISLASSTVLWSPNIWYDFSVAKSGSQYSLSIDQGSTNIFSATVTDSAFATGNVGLHTASPALYP